MKTRSRSRSARVLRDRAPQPRRPQPRPELLLARRAQAEHGARAIPATTATPTVSPNTGCQRHLPRALRLSIQYRSAVRRHLRAGRAADVQLPAPAAERRSARTRHAARQRLGPLRAGVQPPVRPAARRIAVVPARPLLPAAAAVDSSRAASCGTGATIRSPRPRGSSSARPATWRWTSSDRRRDSSRDSCRAQFFRPLRADRGPQPCARHPRRSSAPRADSSGARTPPRRERQRDHRVRQGRAGQPAILRRRQLDRPRIPARSARRAGDSHRRWPLERRQRRDHPQRRTAGHRRQALQPQPHGRRLRGQRPGLPARPATSISRGCAAPAGSASATTRRSGPCGSISASR